MSYRDQLFELVAEPPRYPAVDWTEIGKVAELWIPEDGKRITVGWLVSQSTDRLAFVPAQKDITDDSVALAIQRDVENTMRVGALTSRPAPEVWDEVLGDWLHTMPRDEFLPALRADIGF